MAAPLSQRLIFVDDLEVWVLVKRVRNVSMRVKPPDGRIEVSVPRGTSDRFVKSFVREHRAWIDRNVQRVAASPMAQAEAATKE